MLINFKNKSFNTIERGRSLAQFYKDIQRFPLLSQEEEYKLFEIVHKGTKEEAEKATAKLIECNQRFVVSLARRYATSDTILDFINEGNFGLIQAIEKFDYKKNVKFSSFMIWWIRKYMSDYAIQSNAIIKQSNFMKTTRATNAIKRKFYVENERNPTNQEIQEILYEDFNIKISDYKDLIEIEYSSIDSPNKITSDFEEYQDMSDFNNVTSSFNLYEKTIEENEIKEYIKYIFKSCLNEKEKQVVKLTYGIECDREYTATEISRIMNLTLERVRQIKSKSLQKMIEFANKIKKSAISNK